MHTFPSPSPASLHEGIEFAHPEQVVALVESTTGDSVEFDHHIGNEFDRQESFSLEFLTDLEETLQWIKDHPSSSFFAAWQQDASGTCWPTLSATPDVLHLCGFPCDRLHAWLIESKRSGVHPYISEYLRYFSDVNLTGLLQHPYASWEEADRCARWLNQRLRELQAAMASAHVQRDINRLTNPRRHSNTHVARYVKGLFQHYSRLLVVRVDLGYHESLALNPVLAPPQVTIASPGDLAAQSTWPAGATNYVRYDEIRHHRQVLLDHIRASFGKNFCGYIWKLEYGLQKGYHYHLMLFFNGAHLRKDVVIGQTIGEHWNTVVTGGRGVYRNCNADKDRYHYCGLGMVPWHSAEQMTGVEMASDYLAKPDFFVRQDMPRCQRIIGTGRLPERGPDNAPRRGRPRKPLHQG